MKFDKRKLSSGLIGTLIGVLLVMIIAPLFGAGLESVIIGMITGGIAGLAVTFWGAIQ